MEESKALHKLLEIADLIGMVEDIVNPQSVERLSPSAWSGMRITLRNVREGIVASHSVLAGDLVARSRGAMNGERHTGNGSQNHSPIERASASDRPSSTPVSRGATNGAGERSHLSGAAGSGGVERVPLPGAAGSGGVERLTRQDLKASLEKIIERN